MRVQAWISKVRADDLPRVVEVWEAAVRATHHFLSESDIQFFKPLIPEAISQAAELVCVRDGSGQVAGFLGVEDDKVEMLFVHPTWRGQGLGGRLLRYAVEVLGARLVDVNEQNGQALPPVAHEVNGFVAGDGFRARSGMWTFVTVARVQRRPGGAGRDDGWA